MNPYRAYQQQAESRTRIDLLLGVYEGALNYLERARSAHARNDRQAAHAATVRAQILVATLGSCVDPSHGELAQKLRGLYEFAGRSLGSGTAAGVEAALRVLRPLAEGFQGIRDQAAQLERDGALVPLDATHALQTVV